MVKRRTTKNIKKDINPKPKKGYKTIGKTISVRRIGKGKIKLTTKAITRGKR